MDELTVIILCRPLFFPYPYVGFTIQRIAVNPTYNKLIDGEKKKERCTA